MGTFVIAQKTQEVLRKNGKDAMTDVFVFAHKPHKYSSVEDAAEECEKKTKKNIFEVWCVFELKTETRISEYPIKTFIVEDDSNIAGSAEP